MRRHGARKDDELEAISLPEGDEPSPSVAKPKRLRRPALLSLTAAPVLGLAVLGMWWRSVGPAPTRLCPVSPSLREVASRGFLPFPEVTTDRRQAIEVLRSQQAQIRSLFPYVTSMAIGPGWGTDAHGKRVHDYAIIARVKSPRDCPPSLPISSVLGVPIFFALP